MQIENPAGDEAHGLSHFYASWMLKTVALEDYTIELL